MEDVYREYCKKHARTEITWCSELKDHFYDLDLSSLKWTVLGQNERSMGVKLDGPNNNQSYHNTSEPNIHSFIQTVPTDDVNI